MLPESSLVCPSCGQLTWTFWTALNTGFAEIECVSCGTRMTLVLEVTIQDVQATLVPQRSGSELASSVERSSNEPAEVRPPAR